VVLVEMPEHPLPLRLVEMQLVWDSIPRLTLLLGLLVVVVAVVVLEEEPLVLE
jgi:hypothetical protein